MNTFNYPITLHLPDNDVEVDAYNPLCRLILEKIINNTIPDEMYDKPEAERRAYIKSLVAPTGDGKTTQLGLALLVYINAVGKEEFIKYGRPWIFASSVKSSLPYDWNSMLIDENGNAIKGIDKKSPIYRTLVKGNDEHPELEHLTDDEFKKIFFIYKSSIENLLDNFTQENFKALYNPELGFCEKFKYKNTIENIQTLLEEYHELRSKKKNRYNSTEDIQKNEQELRDADKELRKYVKDFISQKIKNAQGKKNMRIKPYEYLAFIEKNPNFWVFADLYPEIRLCEKKLIFLTVNKLFSNVNPIIEAPNYPAQLNILKGGHIIIDESHKAYETMKGMIIEDIPFAFDYFALLKRLHENVSGKPKFEDFWTPRSIMPVSEMKNYEEIAKKYEDTDDGLRQAIVSLVNEINATYPFMSDKIETPFMIFNGYSTVKAVSKDKKDEKCCIIPSKSSQNLIAYRNKEDEENNILLTQFSSKCKTVFDRFFAFVANCAMVVYFSAQEKEKKYPLNAIISEISQQLYPFEFQQGKKYKGTHLIENLVLQHSPLGRRKGYVNNNESFDMSHISMRGFDYKILSQTYEKIATDNDEELYITQFLSTECHRTPELLLLGAAKAMNVTLMSAHADAECLLGNFDLPKMNVFCNDELYMSDEEYHQIGEYHSHLQKNNEKVNVEFIQQGINEEGYLKWSLDMWEQLLFPKDKKVIIKNPFARKTSAPNTKTILKECGIFYQKSESTGQLPLKSEDHIKIFNSIRLFQLLTALKDFIIKFNDNKAAHALYYSNVLFSDNKEAPLTTSCLHKLANMIIESNPLKTKDENGEKMKANDFILIADASSIAKTKDKCQELLYAEKPCFILTTFASAGVAQNFQAYVSKERYMKNLIKVGKWDIKEKKHKGKTYVEAAISAIGMENVTNIIYDYTKIRKEHDATLRAQKVAEAIWTNYALADAGDVKPSVFNINIGELLPFLDVNYEEYSKNKAVIYDEETGENTDNEITEEFDIKSACRQMLYETPTVHRYATIAIEQVVGRFNRASLKWANETIYLSCINKDTFNYLHDWGSPDLMTHEVRKLYEYVNKSSIEEDKSSMSREWTNAALQTDIRTRNILHKVISKYRLSLEGNKAYLTAKELAVKNVQVSKTNLRTLRYQDFYIATPKRETTYYLKFKKNVDDLVIEKISLQPEKGLHGYDLKDTNLPLFLKYEGFSEYLQELHIPTEWNGNDYMLSPYALISLYQGYIGELFAEFVLKEYKIELNELSEHQLGYDLFEKFDFALKDTNILVDIKNWHPVIRPEHTKEKMLPHIINKAIECKAHKLLYINCVGPVENIEIIHSNANKWGMETDWDVDILTIPGLVDNNCKVHISTIKAIKNFMKND